jgi:signal transduction histidine kinase/ActR/RegA family two-component response regulator
MIRTAGRSFGDRITRAVTVVSGVAVMAVAVALVISDHSLVRRQTLANARSQAAMVTLDSAAALVFDDAVHAEEALENLRAAPDVAAAVIFEQNGARFATYQRPDEPAPLPGVEPPGERIDGRWLILSQPVVDLGAQQGHLQIVFDLAPLGRRLRISVVVAIVVSMVAMMAAYVMARAIRGGLVAPIDELVRTAQVVSKTRDYSTRADKLTDDELGQLTDAFNEMLAQIDMQERELSAAHANRGLLLERERLARAEAEQANRMKDEFLSTLSHELRTPLTPIMGWLELLRSRGLSTADVNRAVEVMDRNARLLTRIIDDLLDMSRIIAGKIRLDVQRVELPEVIEAAISTVAPAAEARSIRIQSVLDPAARWVRGDAARIQQVVWNLLSNAIRFTPKGGRVQVGLARVNSHVEIVVSDTGQGISADFLPHVFDRFRQADSSTMRQHGGLGLGLAIVRQLVQLHGGTVRADSPGEGLGATFTVNLPLMLVHAEDDPAEPREHPRVGPVAAPVPELPSLSRLRVLVVDDDADARELLATILESHGAVVLPAADARQALEKLRVERPDVLMSDIGMPGIDGYELIRRVRALPPEQGGATPALALTAFARSEDRTRALLAGYQLHLSKPVQSAEVIVALARLSSGGTGSRGGTAAGQREDLAAD